jgi:hypothetical protein
MVYALVYAENADIVATYDSYEAALTELAAFVEHDPYLQDEIGLRPYEDGRPAGDWTPASQLVEDHTPHLAGL